MEVDIEAQLEAMARLEALKKEKEVLLQFRAEHQANKKQLKSDLKKGTAYAKKISAFTADGLNQCIKDVEILNLTPYISEIVDAICVVDYKITDVPGVVGLCVALHRRYEDFTAPLVRSIRDNLISDAEEQPDANKKKRIQLRFFIELFQNGLHSDEDFFCQYLRKLLGKVKGSEKKRPIDLPGLSVFVKFASEVLMGYVPSKYQSLATQAGKAVDEVPLKVLCSPQCSRDLQMLVDEVYLNLCEGYKTAHRDMVSKERKLEKECLIHGTASEQSQQKLDDAKKLFDKLHSAILSVSEACGKPVPELQVEKEEEVDTARGISVWEGSGVVGDGGPYGDADSKSFYEDLPDILSMVPLAALGLTAEQAAALREKWKAEKEEPPAAIFDEPEPQLENIPDGDDAEADVSSIAVQKGVLEPGDSEETPARKLLFLLEEKLPDVVTKQKADDFCVTFCYSNSKSARKKLVESMHKIPRGRLELIPNFGRIIACLNKIFGDLGEPIVDLVFRDFYGMYKTRSLQHVESKIRNIRYMGELIKFKVAPPVVAFRIFKFLYTDFTNHNIELLAVFMESCGRYLYLLPYTHDKMQEILETVQRLRKAKHVDLKHQTLLEAAYFTVIPPEPRARRVKAPLTVVQQFIHFLIKSKLEKSTILSVVKSLRRLPWKDENENVDFHIVKAMLSTARKKYATVSVLGECIANLSKFKPNTVILLIDRLLEELVRGLEMPYKRDPQRMLSQVRFISELYICSIVSLHVLYDTMFMIINFGHEILSPANGTPTGVEKYNPNVPTDLDPASDCFRAQLICEILNTCGSYFVRGNARQKLSQFLIFFQRYLLNKPVLPTHVEFAVLDMFDALEERARTEDLRLAESQSASKKKDKKKKGKYEKALVRPSGPVFSRFDSIDAVQAEIDLLYASGQVIKNEEVDIEIDDDDDNVAELEVEDTVPHDQSDVDDEDDDEDDDCDGDEEEEEEEDCDDDDDEAAEEDYNDYELTSPVKVIEEDEDFDKAFREMMVESIDSVKTQTKVGTNIDRMAIPTVLPKPKNTFAPLLDDGDDISDDDEEDDDIDGQVRTVSFKLLSRDNRGRIETRQLLVPEESTMAIKLQKSEQQEREQRQQLKARVLELHRNDDKGEISYIRDQGYISRNETEADQSERIAADGRSLNLTEFLAVSDTIGVGGRGYSRGGLSGGGRGSSGRRGRGSGRLREF